MNKRCDSDIDALPLQNLGYKDFQQACQAVVVDLCILERRSTRLDKVLEEGIEMGARSDISRAEREEEQGQGKRYSLSWMKRWLPRVQGFKLELPGIG